MRWSRRPPAQSVGSLHELSDGARHAPRLKARQPHARGEGEDSDPEDDVTGLTDLRHLLGERDADARDSRCLVHDVDGYREVLGMRAGVGEILDHRLVRPGRRRAHGIAQRLAHPADVAVDQQSTLAIMDHHVQNARVAGDTVHDVPHGEEIVRHEAVHAGMREDLGQLETAVAGLLERRLRLQIDDGRHDEPEEQQDRARDVKRELGAQAEAPVPLGQPADGHRSFTRESSRPVVRGRDRP